MESTFLDYKRIKALRKRLGLSQEKFAEKIGLSQGYVSELETGKKPISIDAVSDIASKTGANTDFLVYGNGPMLESDSNEIVSDKSYKKVGPKVGFYRDLIMFLGAENIQGTPNDEQETWLRGEIGKIRREIAEYYTRALKIRDLAKYGGATLFVILDKWDFGPIESIYLEFVKGENPDSSHLITYAQRAKNALYDLQTQFFALFDEYERQLQKRYDKSFQAYLEAEKEHNQHNPKKSNKKTSDFGT